MSRLPASSQNDMAEQAAGSFRERGRRFHCLAHRSQGLMWKALVCRQKGSSGVAARTDAGTARLGMALSSDWSRGGIFLAEGDVHGGGLLWEPCSSRLRKPSPSRRQLRRRMHRWHGGVSIARRPRHARHEAAERRAEGLRGDGRLRCSP
jgi:hypothetical protein